MKRQHIKTTTNHNASVYQNYNHHTSKSGQVDKKINNKQQSKYFTFDGNNIFNSKNPVSPARGHLATIFVRQKLGKERYEKVLQILSEADDPLQLLNIHKDLTKD